MFRASLSSVIVALGFRFHLLPPGPLELIAQRLANRVHIVFVCGLSDPALRASFLERSDARVVLYEPQPRFDQSSCTLYFSASFGPVFHARRIFTRGLLVPSFSSSQISYALADRRPDFSMSFDPALYAASVGVRGRASGAVIYLRALASLFPSVVGFSPIHSQSHQDFLCLLGFVSLPCVRSVRPDLYFIFRNFLRIRTGSSHWDCRT